MLWWGLLCACMGLAGAADPVGTCGLDGFNLDPLRRGTFWTFTINNPKENCFHEIPDDDVVSCIVFFSICQPLPEDLCGESVSVCQVVTDSNGVEYYYDTGNYLTDYSFIAFSSGFYTIQWGDVYPNEQLCNTSALATVLEFECDPGAKYDADQPYLTQYLVGESGYPDFPCYSVYTLKYSGACYVQPTLAPSHCSLEGYDIETISEREYWTAELPSGACIGIDDTCKFVFAFCHPLPLNLSENCRNPESAICQTNQLVEATNSWSMGAFDKYTRFYENDDTSQAGFHVTYSNGSDPGDPSCTDGLSTRVIFVCSRKAYWDNEDVTLHTKAERDGCNYNIVMQYNGACTTVHTPSNTSDGFNSRIRFVITVSILVGASIAVMFVVMIILTVIVLVVYKVYSSRRSSTAMLNFASDTPANRNPRPVAPTVNAQPNEEDEDDANGYYTTYPQTQALL